MNDLTNPASTPTPAVESLEKQLQSLQKLFVVALTILLLISGSVMIFFWGQKRILNSQLRDVQKFVDDYEKTEPQLRSFVSNLQVFAKTHSDFNSIAAKYNLQPSASNAEPKAASPALPSPAPKTPKK